MSARTVISPAVLKCSLDCTQRGANAILQTGGGARAMYDVKLIRVLCGEIADEPDALRAQELCELLRAIINENDEEISLRLKFLKRKYDIAFESIPK